jgi:putative membrane protein
MSIRRLMATAAGALAIAAGAGQMSSLQAQNTDADFKADNAFVNEVAAANLMEVRLGQIAGSKAQTPAVKQFGAKMVNDHNSMQQLWMATARKHGAAFNARYTPEQQQDISRLSGLSGTQFEQAYMDLMVQDHQKDLAAFKTQGYAARSADVRELATRFTPALQEHYNLATQVRSQVSGGAAVATNPSQPAQQQGPVTPWENVKKDPPREPTPSQQPTGTAVPAPTTTAQTTPASTPAPVVTEQAKADVKTDAKFIREVAADNLLELRMAELAAGKAQNPSVKQYAQKLIPDNTWMQEQWSAMASQHGMPVTPGIGKRHLAKLKKLQKLSGRDFDRAYMTIEVQNHKDYLDYFQREGRAAHSAAVRELVERHIPALQTHFNLAKQIGPQVDADVSAQVRTTSSR